MTVCVSPLRQNIHAAGILTTNICSVSSTAKVTASGSAPGRTKDFPAREDESEGSGVSHCLCSVPRKADPMVDNRTGSVMTRYRHRPLPWSRHHLGIVCFLQARRIQMCGVSMKMFRPPARPIPAAGPDRNRSAGAVQHAQRMGFRLSDRPPDPKTSRADAYPSTSLVFRRPSLVSNPPSVLNNEGAPGRLWLSVCSASRSGRKKHGCISRSAICTSKPVACTVYNQYHGKGLSSAKRRGTSDSVGTDWLEGKKSNVRTKRNREGRTETYG